MEGLEKTDVIIVLCIGLLFLVIMLSRVVNQFVAEAHAQVKTSCETSID